MGSGTQPSIAIVGSGFSGIGLAIKLRQAGFTDVTIFEKAHSLGGVWRDNTYPGAACDAPSHLYSYSFELNPDRSRRFATQPEILEYLRHCASKHQITEIIRFGAEITHADFDQATGHWTLRTASGEIHAATLLISACGQLSRPALPDLPGLDTYQGTVFHSAQWKHDHNLRGRRVAVIGNGASAVQFVPEIAPHVAEMRIFQRETHWISPKWDRCYPRWRRALNRRAPWLQKLPRLGIFIAFELLLNPALVSRRARTLLSAHVRAMCLTNLRAIDDPGLRRDLTPGYEPGCKRILASNDYYQALNRPNVHIVDRPVTGVTAHALTTADGRTHPADTIILATGFRSHDFIAPMRVTGLHKQELNAAWRSGARAHLGLAVPGFPNFFLMYGPNTNLGSGSIVYMLECQMDYIVQAARLLNNGVKYLHLREDTLQRFDHATQRRLATTVWNAGGCQSWYLDNSGKATRNASNWPGYMLGYRQRTRRLRPTDYQYAY